MKSRLLDTARHSKIEACGPNEEDHARVGQADEEDRFCKVAACPKGDFSTECGIHAEKVKTEALGKEIQGLRKQLKDMKPVIEACKKEIESQKVLIAKLTLENETLKKG